MTLQKHILPVSLESDDFDKELLVAPEMLRDLVENYKRKKLNFDKQHEKLDPEEDFEKEASIFDHLVLYNIPLSINHYTGNNTTKCPSGSMSDNRDLTEIFHQNISSHCNDIASAF